VSVTSTDTHGNATTLTASTTVTTAPVVPVVTPPVTPPAVPGKPVLTGLKLTKKAIHVVKSADSPRATRLKLTLDTDATLKVKLKRTKLVNGKVVKAKVVKALTKGASAIKLTSKIGSKKLPPGVYKVTVTARNSVGTSAAVVRKLRVLA
jgi:hypothetical protein